MTEQPPSPLPSSSHPPQPIQRKVRPARILSHGLIVGAIGFTLGFCGPVIFAPQANQGPLLGIFITGPLGFFAGIIVGAVREFMRIRG
ncbi:MAG: hypothetical protein L0Y44_05290 [Phycisphaerales bacterium]|nr:hypothetical protein [Phycisphaerales bacterium]MCI0630052.1 hypothetical protein [Phycisphaerales bacterium]MCI0676261.1 hypothetical protein [Phycisphaerales bacterium]